VYPGDLVLLLRHDSVTVLSGPVVLPELDLSTLIAFAGFDVPITGTLSGTAFPVPGPKGAEALYLVLFSDDLALSRERFDAGFARGRMRVGGHVLLPRRGAGLAVFMEELAASLEGLTVAGRQLGPALDPVDLAGSLRFDTDSDNADWTLEARDGQENVSVLTEGILAGVLSAQRHLTASVQAKCTDLKTLAKTLGTWATLPGGLNLEGGVTATAGLTGEIERMDIKGMMHSSGLRVGSSQTLKIPVQLDASFSGSFREGTLEEIQLETKRFKIGEIASPKVSLAHGPKGMTGKINIDSIDVPGLVTVLGPVLPEDAADYQWGGKLGLSGTAEMGARKGSSPEGGFAVRLQDGQFTSGDYQRMGEGIDLDINGTFRPPPVGSSVALLLDAASSKGEIVIGDLYGDLSKTLPRFRADLGLDHRSRTLQIRSSGLTLDGVGTVALKGRFSQGPSDVRARTKIEIGPIDLAALLDRVLRDGMGGRYPGIAGMGAAGTLKIDTDLVLAHGSYRLRGTLDLENASLADPAYELSVRNIEVKLPFSLTTGSDGTAAPGPSERHPTKPGTLTVEGIDFRGIEIPKVHARALLADSSFTLQDPMRIEFAGGSVNIEALTLDGLGSARKKGKAILEIASLDLAPLARAAAGKPIEGRLNGRFDRLAFDDGTWGAAGHLGLQIQDGQLSVEGIEVEAPPSGAPSARCSVRAEGIPLEALSREFVEPPLKGTLDGELSSVRLAKGRLHTKGSLTFSPFDGKIVLSELQAGDLHGPNPFVQLDVDMKEIDLAALTSPLEFGQVSGVLEGRIGDLRIRPGFPYATVFDARLETVKRRGVPQKIDARAVETLSRIGGSNQLASVLSMGLYRYFDEYYYKKMGIQATLEDGWLELHGIPKGDREYLIVRAFRVPTLSMPILVMTPNHKIRFNRWVKDLMRLGE
jgi:hypothetical protein